MKKLCAITALLLIIVTANAQMQMLDFSLEPNILGITRLNYGQEIEIVARARGVKLAEARSLEMTMRISETETVEYFTQLSHDTFTLKTRMPENRSLRNIFISFKLEANVDGSGISVNKPHRLELTDELIVTLVEPASGKTRLDNDLDKITARITHINGAPFRQPSIMARLSVDGEPETIRLQRDDELFVAELSEPIPAGENEIILSLTGNYSGRDTSQTEPGMFFEMLLALIAVGFSVIILYFLFNYIKSNSGIKPVKKRESKRLEEVSLTKPEETPESKEGIEEIKISEFKKRISEPTFTDQRRQQFSPPSPQVQQQPTQQSEQPKKMEYILPEEKTREPAYTPPRQQPPVEQRPKQDYDQQPRQMRDYDQQPSPRQSYDTQVPEPRERRDPILPEEARLRKSYDYGRQDRPAKQRRGYEYIPEQEKPEEEIVERKTEFLPKIQPSSEIQERPRKPDYQERQQFSPQRPEPRESRESVEYRSQQQDYEPAEHQKDDKEEKKKKGLSPYFIPRKDER